MAYRMFVINPGSTSTKIAVYLDDKCVWQEKVEHSPEDLKPYPTINSQLDMRYELLIKALEAHGEKLEDFDGVVARGGLVPSVSAGAYEVDELLMEILRDRPLGDHASNLGAALAYKVAQKAGGVPACIYDPVTVDEMLDIVRITGIKEIRRRGQGHNLNMRAKTLTFCKQTGMDYNHSNIITVHLGGGISVGLFSNGRIIDMTPDYEGPFSPERAGDLPSYLLLEYIESHGGYDYKRLMHLFQREGGMMSLMGTTDMIEIEKRATSGKDEWAALVYDAQALSVAKYIGKLSVVVNGQIDAIILTGGIANSKLLTGKIAERVKFIAPVHVLPGEDEMEALASGMLRVLKGEEKAKHIVG